MERKVLNDIKLRKPRILFDMDDVLVDYLGNFLDRFNKDKCTSYKIEDFKSWFVTDTLGEEAINYLYEEGMYKNIKPKKYAIEVMKRLIESDKYDIFIVSACFPNSYLEKLEWLKRYMPFFPTSRFIPCSEKSAVWGDFLVDDCPKNLIDYEEIGTPIVYDMPTNRYCSKLSEYKRISNLKEFELYLEDIYSDCSIEIPRPQGYKDSLNVV